MKKLIIMFGSLLLGFVCVAQEYIYVPIPTEEATWNVFHQPPANQISQEHFITHNKKYSTIGDTIINGENWTKIVLTSTTVISDFSGNVVSTNVNQSVYQGAYLETNKIVRFCSPTGNIDTLYDFNVNIGDTISYINFKNLYPELQLDDSFVDTLLIVNKIDSILVGDNFRRRIEFNVVGISLSLALQEVWIEGIGSLHGFLFPLQSNIRFFQYEIGEQEILKCFWENNYFVWGNDNNCELINNINDPNSDSKIKLYPNPSNNFITVELPENLNIDTFKIFDTKGSLIKIYQVCGKHKLEIENLTEGVYLYSAINKNNQNLSGKIIIK